MTERNTDSKRPPGWCFLFFVASGLALAGSLAAQEPTDATNATSATTLEISAKVEGMTAMPGFLPLYWDAAKGQLWLEVSQFDHELLYSGSLAAGVGSNDIGLDRGQPGREHIVEFRRVGPRVLLVAKNSRYRAISDNPDERRAVQEAFAESVLWGFDVVAETDGRVLVDATGFSLRDSHGVAARLKATRQGTYRLEPSRSAVYLQRTRSFPKNTEIEATLTFLGEPEGEWIRSVVPDSGAVSVRTHHSFVELPDELFRPRIYDPRSSFISHKFADYATSLSQPLFQRYAMRYRLEKKNPRAKRSEAKKPIVYYLDRGAPEPIRSALLDGARWWNQAFEAAGYIDAFQVELLPEDADPMDLRYNLIQWVHRSTRGWSYGGSVVDPRTGEILKGQVTLGSLRVRQDFLIAQSLLAPFAANGSEPRAMEEMALARLRQLSAHEVGHAIGLTHNFAASAHGRASVMDYPHPWIELTADGRISLDRVYAVGIGEWDKRAIAWGYSDFAPGTDEGKELDGILRKAAADGLEFISDADARPTGGAHPRAHLWDNGADAAAELLRLLDVREAALARFSEDNVRFGEPLSNLADVLVPVYLLHRYQVEAAAKLVGGVEYTYAVRGAGAAATVIVPAAAQEKALDALLRALSPRTLTLPERIVALIPPPAEGYERGRENFPSRTGVTFDPVSAAEVGAGMVSSMLFDPQRATRLVEQAARDGSQLGLAAIVDRVLGATWQAAAPPGLAGTVKRAVDQVVVGALISLAGSEEASGEARGIALAALQRLSSDLQGAAGTSAGDAGSRAAAVRDIRIFLDHPGERGPGKPPRTPDGSPIGEPAMDWLNPVAEECWSELGQR